MFAITIKETNRPEKEFTAETIEEAVFELNCKLGSFMRRHDLVPTLYDTNYAYALDTDPKPHAYFTTKRVFFDGQIKEIPAIPA